MIKKVAAKRKFTLKRIVGKLIQFVTRKIPFISGKWRIYLQCWRGVRCSDPRTVFIGEDVYFDDLAPELISIGRNVRITEGARILTHFLDSTHKSTPDRPFSFYLGNVEIGDNVFIGMNVVISKPVTIGNGVIIGANSVITKDIPPYTIVGGIPAKKIGERQQNYEENLNV